MPRLVTYVVTTPSTSGEVEAKISNALFERDLLMLTARHPDTYDEHTFVLEISNVVVPHPDSEDLTLKLIGVENPEDGSARTVNVDAYYRPEDSHPRAQPATITVEED